MKDTLPRERRSRWPALGLLREPVIVDRAPTHLSNTHPAVCGDALALPFRDNSFDAVGCSLFLHHLEPDEIVRFAREGLRVARHAFLVHDLQRHPLHLALGYLGMPLYRSRITRHDALASVRRAYTVEEVREMLAPVTPAENIEIRKFFLFRMGVIVWKAAQYDLIVVGAGPAGSACAITAARAGAKVLLLEKDHFPRQKVCGEFVSPESLGLLHGFLEDGRFQSCPQVVSSRIFLDNKTLVIPVSPAAQSIPRFDLDPALFAAAQNAGVTAYEGVTVSEVQRNEVFHVRTSESAYSARAVVNATGRWSKLTQFDVAGKDKWIGLKAHCAEPSPPQSVDLYFFPEAIAE